jgi:HSP20 family molecular chaperone IbpA
MLSRLMIKAGDIWVKEVVCGIWHDFCVHPGIYLMLLREVMWTFRCKNGCEGAVERGLLVVILMMQLVIAWGIFRRSETVGVKPRCVNSTVIWTNSTGSIPPCPAGQKLLLRTHDPFGAMDAMMASAFEDMARMRSAMQLDEGWDSLRVSPTMDMRTDRNGYLVSLSIPGVNSSNVDVSLDGRVLTVTAHEEGRNGSGQSFRHFERRILLPGLVGDSKDIRAAMTNGLLRIHIPSGVQGNHPAMRIRLY